MAASHRRACPGDLDQEGTVPDYRDGRDNKPGHNRPGTATTFAPVTEFRISSQLSGKKGDFLHQACVHRSIRQLAPFWQNEIPLFLQVNSWACRGVGKQGQNLWRQFVIAGLVPAILISRAQCPTLGMAGISPAMTEPEPPRLLPLGRNSLARTVPQAPLAGGATNTAQAAIGVISTA